MNKQGNHVALSKQRVLEHPALGSRGLENSGMREAARKEYEVIAENQWARKLRVVWLGHQRVKTMTEKWKDSHFYVWVRASGNFSLKLMERFRLRFWWNRAWGHVVDWPESNLVKVLGEVENESLSGSGLSIFKTIRKKGTENPVDSGLPGKGHLWSHSKQPMGRADPRLALTQVLLVALSVEGWSPPVARWL